MERKLIDYLPPVVGDVLEMQGICSGEQPQIELIWTRVDKLLDELYIGTASSTGLERWESILNLSASGTVEARRKKILLTLMGERPYTIKWLRNWLSSVLGDVTVTVTPKEYLLTIETGSGSASALSTLQKTIRNIIPANLVLELLTVSEDISKMYAGCVLQVTDTVDL